MKSSRFVQFSGVLSIIGAVYFSLMWLEGMIFDQLGEDSILFLILPIAALFLSAGVVGLYFQGSVGRLGKAGLIIAFLGGASLTLGVALMAWADNENGWGIMMIGVLSHPLGLLIYGIPAFRRRLLPRWHATPLLVGLLAGPAAITIEAIEEAVLEPWQQHTDPGFMLWVLAIGIGWVMLGFVLRTKSEEASAHPAAA